MLIRSCKFLCAHVAGLVKVILLEADDIPGSTHDLFCSLSVGSYSLMSKRDSLTSERSKSGRAVWRQYFEFPIVEGSSDPLCIRLMDRTANGTTTMVGMGRLDVHSMTPGIRQDIKLNIQVRRLRLLRVLKDIFIKLAHLIGLMGQTFPRFCFDVPGNVGGTSFYRRLSSSHEHGLWLKLSSPTCKVAIFWWVFAARCIR